MSPPRRSPTHTHAGRKERYGGTEYGGDDEQQFLVDKTRVDIVVAR